MSIEPSPISWLELCGDYRCNNRCVGCFSLEDSGASSTPEALLRLLLVGRQRGARHLWFGGGEPTLRRDLFGVVAAAKKLGYQRIKLQTNGMMLATPGYAARCARAGITEVNFSIKGATAQTHDRLTQTPGCHLLLCEGIAAAKTAGLAMEGDLLIYRSNLHELVEMVQVYTALGLSRFNAWLFSAAMTDDPALDAQVPRLTELASEVVRAMDLGLSTRADFLTSLHSPPCTVPRGHHRCLFDAAALGLLIADPGGHLFRLEDSPVEGGHYLAGCADCSYRPRCRGAREDYLRIHGGDELLPILNAR